MSLISGSSNTLLYLAERAVVVEDDGMLRL